MVETVQKSDVPPPTMPAQQTVSIGQDHSDYITNLPTTGRQSFPCTVWGLDVRKDAGCLRADMLFPKLNN